MKHKFYNSVSLDGDLVEFIVTSHGEVIFKVNGVTDRVEAQATAKIAVARWVLKQWALVAAKCRGKLWAQPLSSSLRRRMKKLGWRQIDLVTFEWSRRRR